MLIKHSTGTAPAPMDLILDFMACLRVSEEPAEDDYLEDDDGRGQISSYYQTPAAEQNEEEINEIVDSSPSKPNIIQQQHSSP
jgi:hypothetical protein